MPNIYRQLEFSEIAFATGIMNGIECVCAIPIISLTSMYPIHHNKHSDLLEYYEREHINNINTHNISKLLTIGLAAKKTVFFYFLH